MDNHSKLEQLDAKINEARDLLAELESASQLLREQKQHDAIEELDQLFEESELDISKMGPFKDEILAELRQLIEKIRERLAAS